MKIVHYCLSILLLTSALVFSDSLRVNRTSYLYDSPVPPRSQVERAEEGATFQLNSPEKVNGYYEILHNGNRLFVYGNRVSVVPSIGSGEETFSILSWNVQTFGNLNSERRELYEEAIPRIITDNVTVFSFQEVSNDRGRDTLQDMLGANWEVSLPEHE